MGRKTSIVWNHFTIPALYPKKALCNYCHQLVCRGQANLGTTSLMNHLKRCNEFKANVLGIPRGINDMMAAAMSAADAQTNRLGQLDDRHDSGDSVASGDVETSADVLLNEPGWQAVSGSTSFQNTPQNDDIPSLVGRHSVYSGSNPDSPNQNSGTREYQNNERPSTLLYGDISSTSEPTEEPSSSTLGESLVINNSSTFSDLMNYASSSSRVDFVYGGIMLHVLYQQYKTGKCCDMHIIPQKLSTNEVTISETGKVTKKNVSSPKEDAKISVHSSVLAAVSRKINSFVDMGCSTIQLKKGGYESVKGLMEIVYTGKLQRIRTYSEIQLTEILEVARFLEVDYAVQYLMREIPEGKPGRVKNNVEKLIQNRLQSLKSVPSWAHLSGSPAQTLGMPDTSSDTILNNQNTDRDHGLQVRKPPGLVRKRAVHENPAERMKENYAERSFVSSHQHTVSTNVNVAAKESAGIARKQSNPNIQRHIQEINYNEIDEGSDYEIPEDSREPVAFAKSGSNEKTLNSNPKATYVNNVRVHEKTKDHVHGRYDIPAVIDSHQTTIRQAKRCKVEWNEDDLVDYSEEARKDKLGMDLTS